MLIIYEKILDLIDKSDLIKEMNSRLHAKSNKI